MFSKPAFGQTLALLLGLTTTFIVGVAPIDFWWSRIDPIGSSFHRLATAPVFYIGATDVEGQMSAKVLAWRTISSSPRADSLFRQLFIRGSAAARLYAVAGLSLANPRQAEDLRRRLRLDNSLIDFWTPCASGYSVPVKRLVTRATVSSWASLLKNWAPKPLGAEKACAV